MAIRVQIKQIPIASVHFLGGLQIRQKLASVQNILLMAIRVQIRQMPIAFIEFVAGLQIRQKLASL
jgi:hypothetical protein